VPLTIVERKPIRPLAGAVRRLSVSTEVADLLDGRTAFGQFPAFEAERLIGIFCAGQLITISQKKNERRPDLESLEGFDEVWSFCLRRPVPGWRLLGRFLSKDHLILLRGWDKHKLFNHYNEAAQQIIDDWEELFNTKVAHSGEWYSGYLSGVIRDADEPF
jgi:hypothetical protein